MPAQTGERRRAASRHEKRRADFAKRQTEARLPATPMAEESNRLNIHNLAYLEELYARYQENPRETPENWRDYFAEGAKNGSGAGRSGPPFPPHSLFDPPGGVPRQAAAPRAEFSASVSDRLNQMVRNFRVRGHRLAELDPLGTARPRPPELDLDYYGFSASELDLLATSPNLSFDQPLTIREIHERLRNTYCRFIGVQFMHLDDLEARQWLQTRMESTQNRLRLSREEQMRILVRLTDAVVFEEFLRKKFTGAKTFSLEGSETLLPLLDLAIEKGSRQGVRDVILGMAHRGRLNVLAHIIGKDPGQIFREFADNDPESWLGRGDVRYHLGHSGEWTAAGGAKVGVSLCFNPSHLEFVNPVVLGRVRARQDRREDKPHHQVLGLLIHGDAAFAGEGVVQETLNLTKLRGYTVGGALHVILNNQIGFTTMPEEARSTMYATDVARMLQAPIFHVNGEDPEAVAQVVELAMDFRREFQTDVFIDMYGYRRWGHNETDEPAFTQPALYRQIKKRPSVREGYLDHLCSLGGVTRDEAGNVERERRERLQEQLKQAAAAPPNAAGSLHTWGEFVGGPEPEAEPNTAVPVERLSALLLKMSRVPPGFRTHPNLERVLAARREMAAGTRKLDWGTAEALALASLATEGVRIRLTGQDTARGTFSQRHAVLHDQHGAGRHVPLQNLSADQAPVDIVNSPLSETGALGFEYGYSLESLDGLILWEAQFGDFVNAAQVIIDQFIVAAEDKWRQLSGLVLLLPHGFEGMGPEHSSARLERFLQLAAEDNIQVVQPTTPAQYFHCLRRQALWKWRKPLVIFTPKSLLRHHEAVSTLEECASGHFQRVIADTQPKGAATRTLLCSGKIYYDLLAYRQEHGSPVSIVRVEQLYPLRRALLEAALPVNTQSGTALWVQEEPENMGAWQYLHARLGGELRKRLRLEVVARPESASPATGSANAHKLEQQRLLQTAFGESASPAPTASPALQES
jgi:2-oxoglutarate dehydrogenase E1 component